MSDARVRIRLFEFEGPADAANLLLATEGLTVKPVVVPLPPVKYTDAAPAAIASLKKPPARKR